MKNENSFIPTISETIITDKHGELKVQIDFDFKSETIKEIIFKGELVSHFESDINFLEKALDNARPYELAKIFSNQSLSTVLTQGLLNLFNDYLGISTINLSKDLICACYGISRREIVSHCRQEQISFGELMAQTKITTGCGSCLEKTKAVFHHELYSKPIKENDIIYPGFKNLTYAEMLVKIDDLRIEFINAKNLPLNHFIISGSDRYKLELSSHHSIDSEFKKEFSLFVFSRTGLLISFFN